MIRFWLTAHKTITPAHVTTDRTNMAVNRRRGMGNIVPSEIGLMATDPSGAGRPLSDGAAAFILLPQQYKVDPLPTRNAAAEYRGIAAAEQIGSVSGSPPTLRPSNARRIIHGC